MIHFWNHFDEIITWLEFSKKSESKFKIFRSHVFIRNWMTNGLLICSAKVPYYLVRKWGLKRVFMMMLMGEWHKPISASFNEPLKTDLRLQRLVVKAQSRIAKMQRENFPSSFWIFATFFAPANDGNIFSIWIVERNEVDDIYNKIRNNVPIPSTNRTRNMFHLYIKHRVMRKAKILKFYLRPVKTSWKSPISIDAHAF